MLVLGLSGTFSDEDVDLVPDIGLGFFHDAAACLIRNGELVAAVEEERFNRIKQTSKFPINAIRACLATAGVHPSEIDAVGYYFEENITDLALRRIYLGNPAHPMLTSRELIMGHLNGELGFDLPDDLLVYTRHHVSHATSSFIRSGMKEALVVVMDARGETDSTSIFRGKDGQLEAVATYGFIKSLGTFYKDAIKMLAYGLGDEYKVMGLAPYGNPGTYRDFFRSMGELKGDGDFELRWNNIVFLSNGFPVRRKGQEFTQEHMDFAAGLQETLERTAMHILSYWVEQTGLPNLCFTGGVAHNSSLNGLILRSGRFREIFVHPASHDAGAAEGAALGAAFRLGASPFSQPRMRNAGVGPYLGDSADIETELASWHDHVEYERSADIVEEVARLLADGAVVGWAQGRSEYGPRALGNRSIVADARPSENKQRINSMIKKREAYRPFAPVVTKEAAKIFFDLPDTQANYDFMSFVVHVREERRAELGAVTHIDGTARVQIIDPISNERFYRLVQRFGELTGTPVLLNTSFNNNSEPIVQSVRDALTCFLTTELDFLVVEDFLIRRRPEHLRALDAMVPRFRPTTRLAKRIRVTPVGERKITYELYLENANGSRAEVSSTIFTLLEGADGVHALGLLAASAGGLTDDLRRELYSLWQSRFFMLSPLQAKELP